MHKRFDITQVNAVRNTGQVLFIGISTAVKEKYRDAKKQQYNVQPCSHMLQIRNETENTIKAINYFIS